MKVAESERKQDLRDVEKLKNWVSGGRATVKGDTLGEPTQ